MLNAIKNRGVLLGRSNMEFRGDCDENNFSEVMGQKHGGLGPRSEWELRCRGTMQRQRIQKVFCKWK